MEIEVKAKLKDKDAVFDRLEKLGCNFREAVKQIDIVYVRKIGSLEEYLSNDVFVRIRVEPSGRVLLTAKRPVAKGAEVLVKTEHEVVVDSFDEARHMLELMGFFEILRQQKTRRTTHYQQFEICLDDVDGLGSFIELECMGEEAQVSGLQMDMRGFLMSLGIAPEDEVTKGYDVLMLEQMLAAPDATAQLP